MCVGLGPVHCSREPPREVVREGGGRVVGKKGEGKGKGRGERGAHEVLVL